MTKKLEITGRLENWYFDPIFDIIWGNLYDDSKGRFYDGQWIHTSSIPKLKELRPKFRKGYKVRTLNSIYLLGKKRGKIK